MQLYRIEEPAALAVSIEDMKAHLRVDHDDENELIEAITRAVIEDVDGITGIGRALIDQTWELRLSNFCNPIELPLPPLLEVESIKHFDDNNAEQTIATSIYEVVGVGGHSPAMIKQKFGQSWPTVYDRSEPVAIRFRAGYVDLSGSPPVGAVPFKIVAALKLKAATLYAQRETIVIGQTIAHVPAADHLLSKFRVYTF